MVLLALLGAASTAALAQEAQEAQPAGEAQEAGEQGTPQGEPPKKPAVPETGRFRIPPSPSAPDGRPLTLQDRYLDAARRGDLEMIKLCLAKGVNPHTRDELGRSALALAVRDARSLEVADFLRARDLPTDEPDAVGRSPLHDAAGNGDPSLVAWLLMHGSMVNRKDAQGRTPLYNALPGGSHEVITLLLNAGADVNARDNSGSTPLIDACDTGLDEIARLLAERGADPSLKDQEGRTARQHATGTVPFCRMLSDEKPAK